MGFLLDAHEAGDIPSLVAAFGTLERILVEGDEDAQGLAIVGVIEGVQNRAGWKPYGAEPFTSYLGPQASRAWDAVDRFWQGETDALAKFSTPRAGGAASEDSAAFLAAPDVPPKPGDGVPGDDPAARLGRPRS